MKLKKKFSVILAIALTFGCVFSGVIFKNTQKAYASLPALDKFYYTFDLSKITQKPVPGEDWIDTESYQYIMGWSTLDSNSPFTFRTEPDIPKTGFKEESSKCGLVMISEDGTSIADDSTKWIEGRKYALSFEVKILDASGYTLLDTPNVEEGGTHNVHWSEEDDCEVRIGWIEVGTITKDTPQPADPIPTFKYDSSKESSNFLTAGLVNSKDELFNATLTADEQTQVKSGVNASVWLESNDISDKVSTDDKKVVENALPSGYKIGKYTDLNLYKQIGDNDAEKISDCPGGKVKIALDIPSDIKDKNYKMIRLHEGKADVIDTTEVDGKITFETEKFSTYAIAYSEKAGAKTSDNPFVFVIAFIGIISLGALALIQRRQYK